MLLSIAYQFSINERHIDVGDLLCCCVRAVHAFYVDNGPDDNSFIVSASWKSADGHGTIQLIFNPQSYAVLN